MGRRHQGWEEGRAERRGEERRGEERRGEERRGEERRGEERKGEERRGEEGGQREQTLTLCFLRTSSLYFLRNSMMLLS